MIFPSMPQQAAGITAAASCTQSTDDKHQRDVFLTALFRRRRGLFGWGGFLGRRFGWRGLFLGWFGGGFGGG
jgi:hypothetical protein